MATAYNVVYNSFLDKINDYDLADMAVGDANTVMSGLLNQAVVRFLESCKKDLSLTDENGFTEDLDLDEIDILSEGMIESWLKPYRNNLELLRNALSTKDFTTFSPANLLDKVNTTYLTAHANFLSRIKEYSFIHNDVGDLV
jgi:hypothetical protein